MLVPLTLKFPRQQRFVAAAALQENAKLLLQRLLEAQRAQAPLVRLLHAVVALAQMRMYSRLAHGWELVSDGQFEHGARRMDEVGRPLRAWLKSARAASTR